MENFAAIDFETANEQRTSVCSVGVVIVREGVFVDSYYSLIRPEPEILYLLEHACAWIDTGGYGKSSDISHRMAGDSATY